MPSSIGDWYGPSSLRPCAVKREAAGVHPLGDLVVLDRGFHVRRLLGLDELALEQRDVLGVVELDDVGRPVDAAGDQRADRPARAGTTRA